MALATSQRMGWRGWPLYAGLAFLSLAAAALAFELWSAWVTGSYRMIATGELWFRLHPASLNISQAVTQRYLHPSLWDPGIITLLRWPAWLVIGLPGALLTILFGLRFRSRH